jgi:hypothetical protein
MDIEDIEPTEENIAVETNSSNQGYICLAWHNNFVQNISNSENALLSTSLRINIICKTKLRQIFPHLPILNENIPVKIDDILTRKTFTSNEYAVIPYFQGCYQVKVFIFDKISYPGVFIFGLYNQINHLLDLQSINHLATTPFNEYIYLGQSQNNLLTLYNNTSIPCLAVNDLDVMSFIINRPLTVVTFIYNTCLLSNFGLL